MSADPQRKPNRLANETSPYLLQHAYNPVDWYPWGEEAFEKARRENKPLLLSVGYSACHWCHVMAHESFEDPETAALMNDLFVNVKVDREERPDIDNVYMTATQALTGQGGWPMTVFLTPEGQPFYAGTYFPPQDNYGRPGFPRVLQSIRRAWDTDRENVIQSAGQITEHLKNAAARSADGSGEVPAEVLDRAVEVFRRQYDPHWGGFGQAPKFPAPSNLEFLLAHHARQPGSGEPSALEMVLHTLRRMARGGIYDHLGGGFARYSVDTMWLVPHFEKMLYDNAQLARVYLHAFQLTGDPSFERVVRETLAYLVREMRDDRGGFYSAQDADSEGIEGKYFVWAENEVDEVLGEDAALFKAAYGVTTGGNFEDPHHPEFGRRNVLSFPRETEDLEREFGVDAGRLGAKLEELRGKMLAIRERRVRPGLDDKVLTSWNGLALGAFAEAARVLGDAEYRGIAEANAAFIYSTMWRDGRLLHTYRAGQARIDGLLEDYALYGLGLLELYRATGDLAHLEWAKEMWEVLLARFHDAAGGGFFETAVDGEKLVVRQKPFFDAAIPGGNGAAALLGAWLGRYYGTAGWENIARRTVGNVQDHLAAAATGFGSLLQVAELLNAPHREVAIVGETGSRWPFERELASHFLPATVIAPASTGEGLPVLEGRDPSEGAVAYVCENMVCNLPARTPEELAGQLAALLQG
jgi:uncharacterized protein YyaL (SSP411 family)